MPNYTDIPAAMQVIGAIYNNPSLLDNEKYKFNNEDFTEEFHKIIFGSIYNLHQLGAKEINVNTITDYLESRPSKLAVFKVNNGIEYLHKLSENTQLAAFDYYFNRLKKMTLFRMYESIGFDCSSIYDIDNVFDLKKKQAQEDWLDNTSIEKIADLIDSKIQQIKMKYIDNADIVFQQAGEGIDNLISKLMEFPEVGYPLYGSIINTITRGARLGKLYLRSAATGVGKTRAMIADCCFIGCDELYNPKTGNWESNNTAEPCMFITTEQQLDEIQTMMLAFISNVNESNILNNEYHGNELDRIKKAAEILKRCPIYIKRLPDFSLKDIENSIKYGIREWNVKYIFHDYIHTSMKILSEVSEKSKVEGLKEYNILFMIAVRLKDLCVENGVFIETATQLNAEYKHAQVYDQNLLRGAKSIADKIDYGSILLEVSEEDREALKSFIENNGLEMPTIKMSVYKNRRGEYKDILLWCKADRGVCKIDPIFVTDYQYNIINIPDIRIKVK